MKAGNIFNLKDSFEKLVSERLEEHMIGNDYDNVLALMGRDFPFMSAELKAKCERRVFEYYRRNAQGKTFAKLVWMTIGHSRDIDKPMDTHLTTSFHLSEGEDLFVAFQVENPLYGIGEAHVDFSVYLEFNEIDSVKRTMSVDDFRCVYYVPLKVLQSNILSEKKNREVFNVILEDNNVNAINREKFIDVYYGEKSAKDVFSLNYCYLSNEYKEERTDFYLTDYDTLNFHANLQYDGFFGVIDQLHGTVTIAPSDSSDDCSMSLCRVEIGPDESKEGRMMVFSRLVGIDNSPIDIHRPIYQFKPGKYTINFYIWGELMCTREIEFFEEQNEADCWMDELFRNLKAEYAAKKSAEDVED